MKFRCVLSWETTILMQAILNVDKNRIWPACRRFHTPVPSRPTYRGFDLENLCEIKPVFCIHSSPTALTETK